MFPVLCTGPLHLPYRVVAPLFVHCLLVCYLGEGWSIPPPMLPSHKSNIRDHFCMKFLFMHCLSAHHHTHICIYIKSYFFIYIYIYKMAMSTPPVWLGLALLDLCPKWLARMLWVFSGKTPATSGLNSVWFFYVIFLWFHTICLATDFHILPPAKVTSAICWLRTVPCNTVLGLD